jgi:hypothetical protein
MGEIDRRKHVRIKTRNLIAYMCMDGKGRLFSQGMGKASNVSRRGLMLETFDPVDSNSVSLMATGNDNDLIKIQGSVIYCRKADTGMYQTGISFVGRNSEMDHFATELVRAYHYRKDDDLTVPHAA